MALAGHMLSVMKSSAQTKDERQRIELLASMVMLSGAIAKWRQDGGKPVQAAVAARSANVLRDTMPATTPGGQQRLPSQHPTPAPGQTPGQRKGPRL